MPQSDIEANTLLALQAIQNNPKLKHPKSVGNLESTIHQRIKQDKMLLLNAPDTNPFSPPQTRSLMYGKST
jgi:hypothetical protein